MRANDRIVQGDFLGGEIEPGTFHGTPLPKPQQGSSEPEQEQQAPSQQGEDTSSRMAKLVRTAPESPAEKADEMEVNLA
jgi:hypothetical protein